MLTNSAMVEKQFDNNEEILNFFNRDAFNGLGAALVIAINR